MSEPTVTRSPGRAIYVLVLLCLITVLNYYDRNLIAILVEDLKRDLDFSDGQIGLLSGLAFAFVYCVAAIPVARYADGGRRVKTLALSAGVWSVMTGLCGVATGFWTMLAARFGVGLGEAGGAPTTHAIVAETSSARWRGTALAAVAIAGALGVIGAFGVGGYVAHHYGWRVAFYAAAVPGIILAILLALTVREPRTGEGVRPAPVALGEALRTLLRRPAYVWSCVGIAIAGVGAFGAGVFIPAYLMRNFAMSQAEVGAVYAAASGPGTLAGIFFGGMLGDWLSRKDPRFPFYFVALAFGVSGPIVLAYLQMTDINSVLLMILPATLLGAMWIAPLYAIIQSLSGPRLRATGASLFMLGVNLLGQGFGPLVVGAMSDGFAAHHGAVDGLRYALMVGSLTYLVGAACFLVAARTAARDIADAE